MRGAALLLVLAAGPAVPAGAAAAPPPEFQLVLPDRLELDEGQAGALSLTVAPRADRALSREGPLLVELAAEPDGALELPRRRYRRAHAADPRADAPRFDLRLRARTAGEHRVTLAVSFWLCGRRTCWPVRARRAVPVHVRPPPAPPRPADEGGSPPPS